jgi:hypothetical protein
MNYNFYVFIRVYDIQFGEPTSDYDVSFEEIESLFKDWEAWHYHFGSTYHVHESMEVYFRTGGEDQGERSRKF